MHRRTNTWFACPSTPKAVDKYAGNADNAGQANQASKAGNAGNASKAGEARKGGWNGKTWACFRKRLLSMLMIVRLFLEPDFVQVPGWAGR